jgi:hypothetical protein
MLFRRTETRRSGIFNFERNFIMNKTTFAAITLVLGSLLAGQAFAADAATDAKAADKQALPPRQLTASPLTLTLTWTKSRSGNPH